MQSRFFALSWKNEPILSSVVVLLKEVYDCGHASSFESQRSWLAQHPFYRNIKQRTEIRNLWQLHEKHVLPERVFFL